MSDSVGSLYIDVAARTAQLETDMAKVKAIVKDASASVTAASTAGQASGDSMAASFTTGALAAALITKAAMMMGQEFTKVRENILSIPGLSPDVIQSVETMNYELAIAQREIDQAAASLIAGFAKIGNGIGNTLGEWVYGVDAARDAQAKMESEAAAWASKDYNLQMAVGQEKLNSLSLQTASEEGLKKIQQQRITYLQEEATLLRMLAAGRGDQIPALAVQAHPLIGQYQSQFALQGGMTIKDSQTLNLQAQGDDIQAATSIQRMYQQMTTSQQKYSDVLQVSYLIHKSIPEQLEKENNLLATGTAEMRDGYAMIAADDGESAAGLAKMTEGYTKMAAAQTKINQLNKQLKEPMIELENTFEQSFSKMSGVLTQFITTGKANFGQFFLDLVNTMISKMIELALINPLLNYMMAGTGAAVLPAFFADGGPFTGGMAVVGEQGPELVNFGSSSGTVIPAAKTASLMAGNGGGSSASVFIDARGADEKRLQQLERTVTGLNMSIERRAVGAIVSARRRGGGVSDALNS